MLEAGGSHSSIHIYHPYKLVLVWFGEEIYSCKVLWYASTLAHLKVFARLSYLDYFQLQDIVTLEYPF